MSRMHSTRPALRARTARPARPTRATGLAAAAAAVVLALAACAPQHAPSALTERLHGEVGTVAALAASGDLSGALTALQTVKADVAQAKSNGAITAARAAELDRLVATVDGDLQAAIAAQNVPAVPPTQSGEHDHKKDTKSNGQGDQGD